MQFNALGPSVYICPSVSLSSPSIHRPRQPEPEPEPEPATCNLHPPIYPPSHNKATRHHQQHLVADRPKQSNAHDCVSLLPAYLGNQVANPPGHSTHPSLDDYPRAHLWPASETSPLPPFTTFLRPNLQGGPAQHQNSLVPVLVPVLDVDSFPTSNLSRLHHQGHAHINSPTTISHHEATRLRQRQDERAVVAATRLPPSTRKQPPLSLSI